MTVAAAIGQQEPDDWTIHFADTIRAGRGLCNEELSALLCQEGPKRILEMEQWGTRWAREGGHIKQEMAPGHSRRRCCYVDFLNTGPAVAATLRRKVSENSETRRISNVTVIEIVTKDGRALGAVGLNLIDGEIVTFQAKARSRAGQRDRNPFAMPARLKEKVQTRLNFPPRHHSAPGLLLVG
jgi:succinate dehydrogenase / fumarate reductase flavoprotein subunit